MTEELADLERWIARATELGMDKASLRTTSEIRAVGHGDGVTVGPVTWIQVLGYRGGLLLRTPRLAGEAAAVRLQLEQAGFVVKHKVDHIY